LIKQANFNNILDNLQPYHYVCECVCVLAILTVLTAVEYY